MFIRFITSRLLRIIVCAAAGLYGLYNAISCFVTLYKPAKVCQEEKSENSNQNNCCRVQLSIRQL